MYPLLVVFPEILALGLHYVTAFARSDARATPLDLHGRGSPPPSSAQARRS